MSRMHELGVDWAKEERVGRVIQIMYCRKCGKPLNIKTGYEWEGETYCSDCYLEELNKCGAVEKVN